MSELKINAEAIEKRINEIPGVCEDAKKAIKRLLEDGFGVTFEEVVEFKVGGIYQPKGTSYAYFLMEIEAGKYTCKSIEDGFSHYNFYGIKTKSDFFDWAKKEKCKLISPTAEFYFRKKFEGKL